MMSFLFYPVLSTLLLLASASSNSDLCSPTAVITPNAGHYTVLADAWNATSGGFQCLTVNSDGSAFTASWLWADADASTHSYPHITFNSAHLPVVLSSLTNLTVAGKWNMSVASSPAPGTNLSDEGVMANVAIDLFADLNATTSLVEAQASYEIMVWISIFGGAKPLGYYNSRAPPLTANIGSTQFSLYMGTNPRGHTTLSWLPDSNMQDFNLDISPLLTALVQYNLVPADVSIGRVDFGTEAFHSPSNVTFSAADYSLDLTCGSGSCKKSTASPRLAPGLTALLLLGASVVLFLQ